MNSVTTNCRRWQLSILCSLGLAAGFVMGCSPTPSEKARAKKSLPAREATIGDKTPSTKSLSETGQEKTEPAKTTETKTVEAKTPEQKTAEAKTPAKEKPAKTTKDPAAAEKPKEVVAADKGKTPSAPAPHFTKEQLEKIRLAENATPAWLPKPVIEIADAEAKDPAAMKPYAEQIPGTDVKFEMVAIPAGKFMMGSPSTEKNRQDDEGPQHEVQVAPFWMEKHETTWEEYELWGMGLDKQRRELKKIASTERDTFVDGMAIPTKPYSDMTFGKGKEGRPAICMTQFAAKMYCKWLSAKTGRYYRLPTEAEWEYACRAGAKTAYCFGDDPAKLGDYAWYTENSDEKYHKVGLKKPNPWGLYDMHGNVWEWVLDGYSTDFYKKPEAKAPLHPPTEEYNRVVRGGGWDDSPERCRSAARQPSIKDWKKQDPQIPQSIWYLTDANFVGFRVVRPLRVPTAEEAKQYEISEDEMEALKEHLELGKQ